MPLSKNGRRGFLKSAAALSIPYFVPTHVLGGAGRSGANDQIQIGVIGCGVRGKYLISNMPQSGRVISLCDCSLTRIDSVREPTGEFVQPLAKFASTEARACSTYQDYRKMLDHEKLDAVMIATPDHHHVLAAILACQAGMDVYCEKPLSLTIAEGRALVNAVKRHDRVLQVGSQQRTIAVNRFACEFIREGGLGKISHVELRNYPSPMRYASLPAERIPDDLDWNMFLGPTPLRAHNRKLWVKEEFNVGRLLWRGWDLYRDYSGHLMTNWGAHAIDMVQYALAKDKSGPTEIWLEKEKLAPELADESSEKTPPIGTVADKHEDLMRFCPVTMRYANGIEVRFTPGVEDIVFHGERGKLFMKRNDYRTEPAGLAPPPEKDEQEKWKGKGHVARPHIENWLECIKSRKMPNAPVETGHRTVTLCHLGNIVRELDRPLKWNPHKERFVDDDQANSLLDRNRRAGFELPT